MGWVQKDFKGMPPSFHCSVKTTAMKWWNRNIHQTLNKANQKKDQLWTALTSKQTAVSIFNPICDHYKILTGSMRTVPGGPGRPSAPGRPERPGGPLDGKEYKHENTNTDRDVSLCFKLTWTYAIYTHPLTRISRAARCTRRTWGSRETLFQARSHFTHTIHK